MDLELREERSYTIIKANEIIQKARFSLNLPELKLLSFLFSKVKPDDKAFTQYDFSVNQYCRVLGISTSGKNTNDVKQTIEGMVDKGFWLTLENGSETICRWINKAWIDPGSGTVRVRFDDDIQRFICGLVGNYTQYSLLSVLPMKSGHSMRIYEILKSYAFRKKCTIDVDQLREQLGIDGKYKNFKDLRKRVIEPAVKEINLYTDLEVNWQPITTGRKVTQLVFRIKIRDRNGQLLSALNAEEALELDAH